MLLVLCRTRMNCLHRLSGVHEAAQGPAQLGMVGLWLQLTKECVPPTKTMVRACRPCGQMCTLVQIRMEVHDMLVRSVQALAVRTHLQGTPTRCTMMTRCTQLHKPQLRIWLAM